MITTKHLRFTWIMLFVGLVGCTSQAPIVVYVTPTPVDTAVVATTVPTLAPTLTLPEPTTNVPPTAVSVAQVASPAVTFMGPVVSTDYVLPPTSTPRPTQTPLPPTEGPSPTSVPPSATPTDIPPTQQVTPLPGLDPARMGIQLDPTLNQQDWNKAVEDIQRLGVKWLKVQVSWKQLQPNARGEVTEDFRRLETYLETAYNNGAGLDILVSIAKAPNWARSNQAEDGPPDNPQDLVEFINFMLQEFGQAIDAVEVWNEPNLSREWMGKPLSGQSYMDYFVPAYAAINTYSQVMKNDSKTPRTAPITVITAGLAPTSGEGAMDDRAYLQQMYDAGLARYPDVAIGIHPYGWGNAPQATCCDMSDVRGWDDHPNFFFMDNINQYRSIVSKNGHAAKLWTTEFGWATWDYLPGEPPQPWMAYVNECQQGAYITQAFQIGQSLDFMGPMILWNLNFAVLVGMVDNRDERAAYSLIVPLEPRERAAYWMLYAAIRNQQLPSYSRCPGTGS